MNQPVSAGRQIQKHAYLTTSPPTAAITRQGKARQDKARQGKAKHRIRGQGAQNNRNGEKKTTKTLPGTLQKLCRRGGKEKRTKHKNDGDNIIRENNHVKIKETEQQTLEGGKLLSIHSCCCFSASTWPPGPPRPPHLGFVSSIRQPTASLTERLTIATAHQIG